MHTAEVKMGETIKVSFFFSQRINKAITYLVRFAILHLCDTATASWAILASGG